MKALAEMAFQKQRKLKLFYLLLIAWLFIKQMEVTCNLGMRSDLNLRQKVLLIPPILSL